MSFSLDGVILQILEVQSGEGENGPWSRQDFVIQTGGNYPKKVAFTIRNKRCDISPFEVDDNVKVYFDIRTREFNERYYVNLYAYQVLGIFASEAKNALINNNQTEIEQNSDMNNDISTQEINDIVESQQQDQKIEEEEDDLPF